MIIEPMDGRRGTVSHAAGGWQCGCGTYIPPGWAHLCQEGSPLSLATAPTPTAPAPAFCSRCGAQIVRGWEHVTAHQTGSGGQSRMWCSACCPECPGPPRPATKPDADG